MMCFMSHRVPAELFANPVKMQKISARYKSELMWKILEEKDIIKEAQEARFKSHETQKVLLKKQTQYELEIKKL